MLKRDKSFKLPKSVKRVMATMTDQNKMHQYKNLMITASILGSVLVKNKKDKNEKETD
jgi:hypothetical protein